MISDSSALPPESYGNLALEREFYVAQSEAAAHWLDELPILAQSKLWLFEIRCPVKGCLLGQAYGIPCEEGGALSLFLGKTLIGARRQRFLDWGFSDCWNGPPVWFPVGCRHGNAKLDRAWLLDLVDLVRERHDTSETVERRRSMYPEAEQRGLRRRVFHPKPEVWRGK